MNSLAFFLLDLHQPQYIKALIPFQHNLDNTHSVPYHLMSLLKQHHDLHPIQERLHYIDYCGLKNSILFLHAILTISQILKISIVLRNYMKSYTMNLKSCNIWRVATQPDTFIMLIMLNTLLVVIVVVPLHIHYCSSSCCYWIF